MSYEKIEVEVVTRAETAALKNYKSEIIDLQNKLRSGGGTVDDFKQLSTMLKNFPPPEAAAGAGKLSESMELLHHHFRSVNMATYELSRSIPGLSEGMHALHLITGAGGPLLVGLLALGAAIEHGKKKLEEMKQALSELEPKAQSFTEIFEAQHKAVSEARTDWASYLDSLEDVKNKVDSLTESMQKQQAIREAHGTAETEQMSAEKALEVEQAKVALKGDEVALQEKLAEINERYGRQEIEKKNAEAQQKLRDLKQVETNAAVRQSVLGPETAHAEKDYEAAKKRAAGLALLPGEQKKMAEEGEEQAKKAREDLQKIIGLSEAQAEQLIQAVRNKDIRSGTDVLKHIGIGEQDNALGFANVAIGGEDMAARARSKIKPSQAAAEAAADEVRVAKEKLDKMKEDLKSLAEEEKKAHDDYEQEVKKFAVESNERVLKFTTENLKSLWERLGAADKLKDEATKKGELSPQLDAEIQSLESRIKQLEPFFVREKGAMGDQSHAVTVDRTGQIHQAIDDSVTALIQGQESILKRLRELEQRAKNVRNAD